MYSNSKVRYFKKIFKWSSTIVSFQNDNTFYETANKADAYVPRMSEEKQKEILCSSYDSILV